MRALWEAGDHGLAELSDRYGVSPRTIQAHLKKLGSAKGAKAAEMAAAVQKEIFKAELGEQETFVLRAKERSDHRKSGNCPACACPEGSNPGTVDVKKTQDRLIELGFLTRPADGIWASKSRMAFKIANGLAADDKWDDLVSTRLYSTQAVRSPLPLATTGR